MNMLLYFLCIWFMILSLEIVNQLGMVRFTCIEGEKLRIYGLEWSVKKLTYHLVSEGTGYVNLYSLTSEPLLDLATKSCTLYLVHLACSLSL
jgi:hypothetical protein